MSSAAAASARLADRVEQQELVPHVEREVPAARRGSSRRRHRSRTRRPCRGRRRRSRSARRSAPGRPPRPGRRRRVRRADRLGGVVRSVVDDVVGAGRGRERGLLGELTVVITRAPDHRASWIAACPPAPAPPATSTVRPSSAPGPSRTGPPSATGGPMRGHRGHAERCPELELAASGESARPVWPGARLSPVRFPSGARGPRGTPTPGRRPRARPRRGRPHRPRPSRLGWAPPRGTASVGPDAHPPAPSSRWGSRPR